MIIDKLGNKTYTSHELRYLAQDEIARLFSPSSEANIQRRINGLALGLYTPTAEEIAEIDAYKNHLLFVQAESAQAEIDNQLLIDAISYETARDRLNYYELSVGRPEQIVYDQTGEHIEYIVPAVAPLPIDDPLVIKDQEEREAAQTIIDNASADVLALVELRA